MMQALPNPLTFKAFLAWGDRSGRKVKPFMGGETMTVTPIRQKSSEDYPETSDNQAVLGELELVKERLEDETLQAYTSAIDNRDNLQQLEAAKDQLSALTATILSGSIVTGLTTFSPRMLGILLAWKPMTRLEKVTRLIKLITTILSAFEGSGVEMLPLINVPKYQPIDLFIRFPVIHQRLEHSFGDTVFE